jgi:hypothetical protein
MDKRPDWLSNLPPLLTPDIVIQSETLGSRPKAKAPQEPLRPVLPSLLPLPAKSSQKQDKPSAN